MVSNYGSDLCRVPCQIFWRSITLLSPNPAEIYLIKKSGGGTFNMPLTELYIIVNISPAYVENNLVTALGFKRNKWSHGE